MKFKMIIDKTKDEEITATVHAPSQLTEAVARLVQEYTGTDRITVWKEDEMKVLLFAEISCITVMEGKTVVIDREGNQYRHKQRLYELEELLPPGFIRINKSTIANEKQIEHFAATFSGAVDAVFRCGWREYVSRRCYAQIKRRYDL